MESSLRSSHFKGRDKTHLCTHSHTGTQTHTTVIQGKRYEDAEKIISKVQDKSQENYGPSTEMKARILKVKY